MCHCENGSMCDDPNLEANINPLFLFKVMNLNGTLPLEDVATEVHRRIHHTPPNPPEVAPFGVIFR